MNYNLSCLFERSLARSQDYQILLVTGFIKGLRSLSDRTMEQRQGNQTNRLLPCLQAQTLIKSGLLSITAALYLEKQCCFKT